MTRQVKRARDPARVMLKPVWEGDRKRFVWGYEEVRGKVIIAHFIKPPDPADWNEAIAAIGKTVEGWLNHGALSATVEVCPVALFCGWPKRKSHSWRAVQNSRSRGGRRGR